MDGKAADPVSAQAVVTTTIARESVDDVEKRAVRRSLREIRKPKFDDEIVDSSVTIKASARKRANTDKFPSLSSSSETVPGDFLNLHSAVANKSSRKSWRSSEQSLTESSVIDRKLIRKMPAVIETVPPLPALEKRKKERVVGKDVRARDLVAASCNTPSSTQTKTDNMKLWTAADDMSLITAVEHISDLNVIKEGVRFSSPFSLAEIEERWYELLYDEHRSKLALERIKNTLLPVAVHEIQSKTTFNVEEEIILASIGSDSSDDLAIFQEVLSSKRSVFHHARTAESIRHHWKLMKLHSLLRDQKRSYPAYTETAECPEYRITTPFNSDFYAGLEEILCGKQINIVEREMAEWEQVLLTAAVGVASNPANKSFWGVLVGRVCRYLLRGDKALIGRSTANHEVDVDLSREGPSQSISRKQAILKRCKSSGDGTEDEYYVIINIGGLPVIVDGNTIIQGNKAKLFHKSVIEIAQIRLRLAIVADSSSQLDQPLDRVQQ